jgi:D-aminopeptidase
MLFLIAAAAAAAQPASAYTNVDLDRCRVVSRVEEGASVIWRCAGYRGVPLFVLSGDDRFDVDAGIDNNVWESPGRFSAPPARVEWRLREGRPFAIIYRLSLSGYQEPTTTVLAVETIGRAGAPGCVIAWVPGSMPNANAAARAHADGRAAGFRCGRDEPGLLGGFSL